MQIRVASLFTAVLLAGCGDMSGLGGTSQFACKAPIGVHCESLSATYYNSLANNLPSQRERAAPAGPAQDRSPAPAPTRGAVPATENGFAPTGLRSAGKEMRIWIKAWQDDDKDLVDQSFVFLVVSEGRWRVAHVQQQERDAFARLAPPMAAPKQGTAPPPPLAMPEPMTAPAALASEAADATGK